MRRDLIDIVCCPDDKEVLELRDAEEDEHEDVITGKLHCPECGFDFPIEDGIPNLLPKEFHVDGKAGAKRSGQGGKQGSSATSGGKKGGAQAKASGGGTGKAGSEAAGPDEGGGSAAGKAGSSDAEDGGAAASDDSEE